MKILILNPHMMGEHPLLQALRSSELGFLLASEPQEAWPIFQLHGTTVDLAVIHREGKQTSEEAVGLQFLNNLKSNPMYQSLPMILTSSVWQDSDFAQHQQSPQGVNAYLHWPFTEIQLGHVIEQIFGILLKKEEPITPLPKPQPAELVLEESSKLIQIESLPSPKFIGSEESSEINLQPPQEISDLAKSPEIPPFSEESSSLSPSPSVPLPTVSEAPVSEVSILSTSENLDQEIAQEMPYLFPKKSPLRRTSPLQEVSSSLAFPHPIGDAVVPGGAAQTPDLETLRKYLLLREQDVSVLSNQLHAMREQIATLETSLCEERAKNAELTYLVHAQKKRLEEAEKNEELKCKVFSDEIEELLFQLKAKADQARVFEYRIKEAQEEREHLKDRVRMDMRKIRVREKELENRLEIMRKDSEALIGARENKIIELKRKIDLIEFNMDRLQDQYSREKEISAQLKERLQKAAQALRVAGGVLDIVKTTEALTIGTKSENISLEIDKKPNLKAS